MRIVAALACVVALSGCSAAAPEQAAAEDAVARAAGSSEAECTGRSRTWVGEGPPADVFVCAVRADDGFCDQYRAEWAESRFRVELVERRASCVLPAG